MEKQNDNQNQPEEKTWFQKNAWLLAIALAIFIIRMIMEVSK